MVSELLCVQEKKVAIKCLFTLYGCFLFAASILILKPILSSAALGVKKSAKLSMSFKGRSPRLVSRTLGSAVRYK